MRVVRRGSSPGDVRERSAEGLFPFMSCFGAWKTLEEAKRIKQGALIRGVGCGGAQSHNRRFVSMAYLN